MVRTGADVATCLPRTTLAPLPSRVDPRGGAVGAPPAVRSRCSSSRCTSIGVSASTPALLHGEGHAKRGRVRAGAPPLPPADPAAQHDIAHLSQTLVELQREREQIQELKQLAMAAGGMSTPLLGLKGGVLRNLSMGGRGDGAVGALQPLPTRLDPSALS